MAYSGRQTTLSQIQFISGTIGTPVAIKAYPAYDMSPATETYDYMPGAPSVGLAQPGNSRRTSRYIDAAFKMPLTPANVADGTSEVGALLRAAGYSENTGGTTPNIAFCYIMGNQHLLTDSPAGNLDPIDLIQNFDRLSRALKNCVLDVDWVFESGKAPMLEFRAHGTPDSGVASETVSGAVEAALETAGTLGNWFPTQNLGATINIDAGGAVADLEIPKFVVKTGNKIRRGKNVNGDYGYSNCRLAGREPKAILQVKAVDLATINLEAAVVANSLIEVKFKINDGGGVRNEIVAGWRGRPVNGHPLRDDEGELLYEIEMEQSAVSGNEFYVGWKSTAAYSYPF